MTINSGGGEASVPTPVATAAHGWRIELSGCADDSTFASVYDSENVSTPGAGTGPQYLKVKIYQVDEALHIPGGYPVTYMDGATLRTIYLPQLPTPTP